MHSPSRTTWCSKRQDRRTKKSTIWTGMRGRDAARKSTLKLNNLQVFTIDFSEIKSIVNHNSQSDGQNKSAKRWTNLQKKTTYHFTTEELKKIPRTMVSHLEQVRQKWAYATSTQFSSCCLSQKTVSTASQVSKLQNPFLHNNIGDGILHKRFMVGQV